MDNNNEISKYRKKKPSKSKSTNKSDHKHQYDDCLLVDLKNRPHKAEYCIICGNINNVKAFETEILDGGHFRMLTYDEVFQKYKSLKQFQVKDMWDKYVSINIDNKNNENYYRGMTDDEQKVYNSILKSDAQKTGVKLFNNK